MKPLALIAAFSAVLAVPAFADLGRSVDVPVTLPTIARAAGAQRQPHPPTTSGYAFQPKVLATRDGFLLLWTEWDGLTHSLLTASVTQSGFGSPVFLGSIAISSAAMTARDQLALTFSRPAYDPASGGVVRAFLRVWPATGRRRAVQP
jgi:hypothetical protein